VAWTGDSDSASYQITLDFVVAGTLGKLVCECCCRSVQEWSDGNTGWSVHMLESGVSQLLS